MKIEGRWDAVAVGFLTVLRLALGTLFIISATAKLQHPDLFVNAVKNYHMLPAGLADLFGTVLPWVELGVGWSLVLGIFPTFAAGISIPMILSFIVANVASFFKDVGEACGCLGTLVNMTHTTSLVVDFVMLAVSGLLIYQRRRAGVVGIGQLLRLQRLRLPKAGIMAAGVIIVIVAMLVTFIMLPEEKAPWKEEIDGALKDDKVVVFLLWKGEVSDITDELVVFMDLRSQYGASVWPTDVNAEEREDAARTFDVTEFPTILVIEPTDGKGYEVYPQRFAGAEDRIPLLAAIDEVLARG